MEKFKKVCRFCYKAFSTPRKQQRYCGVTCAYRGKNRLAFNNYIAETRKQEDKQEDEARRLLRFRPDNETAGLCLDRECYKE